MQVVVASLVDKVPNLAGLARTCEVFAAECLVLRDVRVAGEAGFKDMSATAAEWVALAECPPTLPALTRYLQERKAQVWTCGTALCALLSLHSMYNSISVLFAGLFDSGS